MDAPRMAHRTIGSVEGEGRPCMRSDDRSRALPALVGLAILLALGTPISPARAADCTRTETGLQPLTELIGGDHMGQPGGLYPGVRNSTPPGHLALAMQRADRIQALDAAGNPDPAGSVVLLSVGMSNTTQEFSTFVRRAAGEPNLHPALRLVDGAQGGQTAADIRDPDARFWSVVDERLAREGVTVAQVQALWLKSANRQPGADGNPDTLPAARQLADDIQAVVGVAADRFPNLQLIYLSSRIYAGYASTSLNPEPYAYESGLAVRWLIQRQIEGEPALDPAAGVPVLLWGPYLWADGLRPRADGLTWACSDFQNDGTHPSTAGREKVAGLLMDFFRNDATSRDWFLVDPEATPAPSATVDPAATQTAIARPTRPTQPGRGTGTPPAAGLRSYRVVETPSRDRMWVSVTNPQTQSRLNGFAAGRDAWICGQVEVARSAEWGFTFEPDSVIAERQLPEAAVESTIRLIASDPAAATGTQCIRIDDVDEAVDGPAPGETTTPELPSVTPATTRPGEATPTPRDGSEQTPTDSRLYLPLLLAMAEPISELVTPASSPAPSPTSLPRPTGRPTSMMATPTRERGTLAPRPTLTPYPSVTPGGDLPPGGQSGPGFTRYSDLEYDRVGDERLLLDLHLPDEGERPYPVILFVNGGAYHAGSKDGVQRGADLWHEGYAVASIDYRLLPDWIYPAQIEDARSAVRWLRRHASEWGLNADRIGAWGRSAGGHLVALLGTASEAEDLDGDLGNRGHSSAIDAVVDWFGPSDLLQGSAQALPCANMDWDDPRSPASQLIGCPLQTCPEKVERANPIAYIDPNDAPFLIMHGTQDCTVPPGQSQILHDALVEAGVPSELHWLEGAGHGGTEFEASWVRQTVVDFFDRTLRGP